MGHLDSITITVGDVEESVQFYALALGMEIISPSSDIETISIRLGDFRINLQPTQFLNAPVAANPARGAAAFCIIVNDNLAEIKAHLDAHAIPTVDGPMMGEGTRGPLQSVIIRDPDGNLIEIANETLLH